MALPEEKRLIRVYMDMKGTQLYISFTNFTAAKKLSKVGRGFKTSKGEGHGFGLVRMDDIVSRYDGYLSRNSEDGAFTTGNPHPTGSEETLKMQFVTQNKQFVPRIFRGRLFVIE